MRYDLDFANSNYTKTFRQTYKRNWPTNKQTKWQPPPLLDVLILTINCFYSILIALFPRLSSDSQLLHPLLFLYKHAAVLFTSSFILHSMYSFIFRGPVLGSFDRNRIYTYQIHTILCDILTFHVFFIIRDCGSYAIALFQMVSLRLCSDKPRWWVNIHQWLSVKISNLKKFPLNIFNIYVSMLYLCTFKRRYGTL